LNWGRRKRQRKNRRRDQDAQKNKNRLAEREGFEPSVRFTRTTP